MIKIEKPPPTDKIHANVRDVIASKRTIALPSDPSQPVMFRKSRFVPAPVGNYRHNSTIEVGGVINGQGLDPVRQMKYGHTSVEKSGCGLIAVYNALVLLGNPQSLADIILWGDYCAAVFCGFGGTNPWAAGRLLRRMGYTVKSVSHRSQYDSEAKRADVCLFTFWNNIPNLTRGMHSVCARYEADAVRVYNPASFHNHSTVKGSFAGWIAADHIGPVAFLTVSRS